MGSQNKQHILKSRKYITY